MVMIRSLYETHLFVENLEISTQFYSTVLGLKQCYYEAERRAAFFWIGRDKEAMLGLWEKPKDEIDIRHFAFRCEKEFVLNQAVDFLQRHNLKPYNFLNDDTSNPMVFSWMPAIAIYFDDPDGHILEFIALLEGDSRPEQGVVSYEDWLSSTGVKS